MRKFLQSVIIVCLVLALSACGNNEKAEKEENQSKTNSTTKEVENTKKELSNLDKLSGNWKYTLNGNEELVAISVKDSKYITLKITETQEVGVLTLEVKNAEDTATSASLIKANSKPVSDVEAVFKVSEDGNVLNVTIGEDSEEFNRTSETLVDFLAKRGVEQ